jgi:hypothetical protein
MMSRVLSSNLFIQKNEVLRSFWEEDRISKYMYLDGSSIGKFDRPMKKGVCTMKDGPFCSTIENASLKDNGYNKNK